MMRTSDPDSHMQVESSAFVIFAVAVLSFPTAPLAAPALHGQELIVEAHLPDLLDWIEAREFEKIGTSQVAILETGVIMMGFSVQEDCVDEERTFDGYPLNPVEAGLSAQRLQRRTGNMAAMAFRHEQFYKTVEWIQEHCGSQRVIDLGRNLFLYFVWADTGGIPEEVTEWEASVAGSEPAGEAHQDSPGSSPLSPEDWYGFWYWQCHLEQGGQVAPDEPTNQACVCAAAALRYNIQVLTDSDKEALTLDFVETWSSILEAEPEVERAATTMDGCGENVVTGLLRDTP